MSEENTQDQSQEQSQDAPFPVAENPYTGSAPDAVAPEVTPAGNPDEASEAPQTLGEEAPAEEAGVAVTMVEGEEGVVIDDTPASIQLQPGDEPVEKPEHLSDLKGPELSESQEAKLESEQHAGAARVQEHEEREKLLASKRENPVPEEVQIAEATEANRDL